LVPLHGNARDPGRQLSLLQDDVCVVTLCKPRLDRYSVSHDTWAIGRIPILGAGNRVLGMDGNSKVVSIVLAQIVLAWILI
jgi:hypothetical protein